MLSIKEAELLGFNLVQGCATIKRNDGINKFYWENKNSEVLDYIGGYLTEDEALKELTHLVSDDKELSKKI